MGEIESRMRDYEQTHPAIFELFRNLKERIRVKYDSDHAAIAEAFYVHLENQYEAIPLSPEEIERDLDTERLAGMPLKDYVELLRKLPPRFFTHITRQGVRDSSSHHEGGEGQFHHGFTNILKDGRVESIYDRILEDGITHATVERFLERAKLTPEHVPNKQKALEGLKYLLTRSDVAPDSSYFADMKAIHAALEIVADEHYGGENSNEIFMIWPAAYVAKEYHIGVQRGTVPDRFAPNEIEKGSQFNDYWLLRKDAKKGSLPLDVSIVFLPAKTKVDARNGSKYELTEDGKPKRNPQLGLLRKVLASDEYSSIREQLFRYTTTRGKVEKIMSEDAENEAVSAYGTVRRRKGMPQHEINERRQLLEEFESSKQARDVFKRLCETSGITDPRILNLPDSGSRSGFDLRSLASQVTAEEGYEFMKEKFEVILGIAHALAENTIPARDYWEGYFTKMGKRPSKVVYYEQASPTAALEAFKRVAGIDRSPSDVDLKKLYEKNIIGSAGIKETLSSESELLWEIGQDVINAAYVGKQNV